MITDNLRDIKSLYNDNNPTLIAVSKNQSNEAIDEALTAGLRVFGENKVQEAYEHWEARKTQYDDLELHLIGPLQTNKVKQAVELFDIIHTLNREKLAKSIHKHAPNIPCFIQVNTGNEPQKSGISVIELDSFYKFCTTNLDLNIIGLMCIPPRDEEPALHFQLLAKLAKKLNLSNLSMGMSGDFGIAINHGATHIRVGTKLFGKRD